MKKLSFALVLFFIAAPLFLLWLFTPKVIPLVISEETTRITGPLTDDGRILYHKALEQRIYPPELVTDDNGFRLFIRQFGDAGVALNGGDYMKENSEFFRLQVYAKLALDPNIPPTLTLPLEPHRIIKDFHETKGEEYDTKQADKLPTHWTLEDFPMLADWINEIDDPMDALADMIQKPIFQAPLRESRSSYEQGTADNLLAMPLQDVQMFRSIARIFSARAAYRIAHGDIDGAIDDKLTLHRFGRLVSPCGGMLVGYLVGIAIESMAGAIPINANPEHPLTEEQIRRILEGLDALPPRTSIHEGYEWERYVALSALQDVCFDRTKNQHSASVPATIAACNDLLKAAGETKRLRFPLFMRRVFDWNVVYRRLNEAYDTLQQPPPLTEYYALLKTVEECLQNARSRSSGRLDDFFADVFIKNMLPVMGDLLEAVQRLECSENMQRLTWATLLYQCEHGMLPDENWATQIEKYLGENPEQYFSCPTNPSPEGNTTYALVRYGETPESFDTFLLVELETPVPLDEAVITVNEVLERERTFKRHRNGMNTVYRSGAVQFLANDTNEEELLRRLGREVAE